MKLKELAARLDCRLEGDGDVEIVRVAGIQDAQPGDVSFIANAKYTPQPNFMQGPWAYSGNQITCSGTVITPAGTKPVKPGNAADVAAGVCAVNCWNQGEIYSFHSGVAMVCLGDGSVRTLKSTISFKTLQLLAARSDTQGVPDLD